VLLMIGLRTRTGVLHDLHHNTTVAVLVQAIFDFRIQRNECEGNASLSHLTFNSFARPFCTECDKCDVMHERIDVRHGASP